MGGKKRLHLLLLDPPMRPATSRTAKGRSDDAQHKNLFRKGRMPIIKTLTKATKLEKEKFKIPKSVQDAIPSSASGRMGFFRWGAGSPRPFLYRHQLQHCQQG